MKTLKVLVACEYSGTVRQAFSDLGHDAWSCDLLPTEIPGNHFQGDIFHVPHGSTTWRWDLIITHPPCTYLCNSGVRWLYNADGTRNEARWREMEQGAVFFRSLLNSNCEYIAIENPVMHRYAKAIIDVEHTQTIQPYEFGHLETKRTCLWLKGLPQPRETKNVKAEMLALPKSQTHKVHYMSPGANRQKERARTYSGIAEAMASQWSEAICNVEGK